MPSEPGDAAVTSGAPAVAGRSRFAVSVNPLSFVGLTVGLVALFVLRAFVGSVGRSLTVIAVGVLLAFAVEPLVTAVQRRFKRSRAASVAVVSLVLLAAVAMLALIVGPPAIRQAQQFGEELPDVLAEFEQLPIVGERLADADFAENIEEWIDSLPSRIDPDGVGNAARSALNGLLNALGVVLVAVAISLDGPALIARIRTLVPVRHRRAADDVGRVFFRVVGTYFAGSLLVACIGGTWVLIVGLAVGVPLAPVAAIWYAVVSLIPQIGGFLGTSFVTILALTQGVVPAIIVLVLVVAYMNTENYIITPAIVGEAVDLSPPVTMLGALVGGAAAGVPGALAAIPLIGTAKALYRQARYGTPPTVERQSVVDRLAGSRILSPLARLFRRRKG